MSVHLVCPNCGQSIEKFVAAEAWCSECPERPLMIESSPPKEQEDE
jgi:hypothetical protein